MEMRLFEVHPEESEKVSHCGKPRDEARHHLLGGLDYAKSLRIMIDVSNRTIVTLHQEEE